MRNIIVLFIIFIISGCVSKSKYDDLEYELSQKNMRIDQLEHEIEEKDLRILELESYVSDLENISRQAQIRANNMSMAVQSARSNLKSAEFWNSTGDEFFSTNHYNRAKKDLNNIY